MPNGKVHPRITGMGITISTPGPLGMEVVRQLKTGLIAHVSSPEVPNQILITIGCNTITLVPDQARGVLVVTRSTFDLAQHQIVGEFDL